MLHIAVCDDEPLIVQWLHRIIESAAEKVDEPFAIKDYTSGLSLIQTLRQSPPDLLFLDIALPDIDGMKIASQMREEHAPTEILFVSCHEERVYESFRCAPFRFLRKSCLEEEIDEALSSAVKKWREKKKTIVFSTDQGKKQERIDQILYVDVYGHKLSVHTLTQSYETNGSLSRLAQVLGEANFVRIHKSYLVSLRYIDFVRPNSVRLDNGETLPVGRGKAEEIQRRLLAYFQESES